MVYWNACQMVFDKKLGSKGATMIRRTVLTVVVALVFFVIQKHWIFDAGVRRRSGAASRARK